MTSSQFFDAHYSLVTIVKLAQYNMSQLVRNSSAHSPHDTFLLQRQSLRLAK